MQVADNTSVRMRARGAERAGEWDGIELVGIRARTVEFLRDVGVPFALTRLLLIIVAVISTASLPLSRWVPLEWTQNGVLPAVDAFARWDGLHYTTIAAEGYTSADPAAVAFFPLYPLLMRTAGILTGNVTAPALEVWGIVISNVALLCAGALLLALCRMDFGQSVASRAAWYLFIFPTSFFLSAVYAESLFLAVSLGAVLAARRDRWLLACALGALAALTRPFGVVILLPLALEAYLRWRSGGRPWRAVVGLPAIPAAFAAYMGYLWQQHGDPLVFLHVEQDWHRTLMPPWQTLANFFSQPITVNSGQHAAVDLAFAAFTIAAVVAAWKLLRPSYALFLTALVLVPLSSGSLGSIMRFDAAFFPVILVLGRLGRWATADRAFTVIGLGVGALLMALFAQWYWVA